MSDYYVIETDDDMIMVRESDYRVWGEGKLETGRYSRPVLFDGKWRRMNRYPVSEEFAQKMLDDRNLAGWMKWLDGTTDEEIAEKLLYYQRRYAETT